MRYLMPNFPCEFEIPDDWIAASGIGNFSPRRTAYRSSADVRLITLVEVAPLLRFKSVPKDWRGLEQKRFVVLLKRFVANDFIPPVPVVQLLDSNRLVRLSYRYCIGDGFHRYYASILAGFSNSRHSRRAFGPIRKVRPDDRPGDILAIDQARGLRQNGSNAELHRRGDRIRGKFNPV
jgi:hypothetical protein